MADTISSEERSAVMSRVKSKNSRPEVALRKLVHSMGYRFRLHAPNMPGKPDLVLARHRAVIFMHGCFWHRHGDCALARMPKSRLGFWGPKLEANKTRDATKVAELQRGGWQAAAPEGFSDRER